MKAVLARTEARIRVAVRGAVQGVGFRPFVHRLAGELGLTGWVANTTGGVIAEAEGTARDVTSFLERLPRERPPRALVQGVDHAILDPVGYEGFEIRESDAAGPGSTLVLPDIASCAECLREIRDPGDRRYRYPFTNCTHCGPRYTIIEALPYDRARTTMRIFPLCEACRAEYENPGDRRFHAQPTACPACGPRLELWDANGRPLLERHEALLGAAEAIRAGRVVAMKSVGGFHLVVDARDAEAVRRLRARKDREEKPLALLFPSIEAVRGEADVSGLEELLLLSPEAPIVLLRRRKDAPASRVAPQVSPGNPNLGIMLPSNPLQHLLLAELGFPIVATSGNRSGEPLCIDNREALERLSGIADLFLVHDRPIARAVDDSIVRVMVGRATILRRARGYAPLPIPLGRPIRPALAVGAHSKGAVAISVGGEAVLSEHLGDLGSARSLRRFETASRELEGLFGSRPEVIACDAHPDYPSTRYAEARAARVVRVQHHHAHALACMAENAIEPPVLGVVWDGTGYGLDGSVWGGEFLRVEGDRFERVARLRPFRLVGGEKAVLEPRRAALAVLHEIYGRDLPEDLPCVRAFSPGERRILQAMLAKGLNAPATSSAGRLIDAVASLLGLCHRNGFEGQAAMALEHAVVGRAGGAPYDGASEDWEPVVRAIVADVRSGVAAGIVAARFHDSLVETIVGVARRAGLERIALSGGCFQNRYLTERAVLRLREEGFQPYWHQRVPPNDGGIAFGQLAALAWSRERE